MSPIPQRLRLVLALGLSLLLCGLLPLVGVVWSGQPASKYLEFPPRTQYVQHAEFSWPAFWTLAVVEVALLYVPLALILIRTRDPGALSRQRFPWWGWCGLFLGAIAWILAWTRFPWFTRWQRHTFTPLWIAYILVVNALAYRRASHCMLTDTPGFFLALFPVSALFWWLFEYLNRFVQNWYYINVGDLSAAGYFWLATLPFSTVLPAVLGTYQLLGTFVGQVPLVLPQESPRRRILGATIMLAIAALGLLGIGLWPSFLFPLLWIAPLLVVAALMEFIGEDSLLFHRPARGCKRLALLAVSALICGFFWEMWNYFSLTKWVYEVPYVEKFHIFEMPVLGYAGYLPFGWECGIVGLAVWRLVRRA